MITVQRRSATTGEVHSMDLPITDERLAAWQAGRLGMVQDVFQELSPEQREFLLSGITPEEWDRYLGAGSEEN